jgi:hypothetical protein
VAQFFAAAFPEAETAYQAIKTVNDPVLVEEWLVPLRSEGLEQPATHQPLLEAGLSHKPAQFATRLYTNTPAALQPLHGRGTP